MKLYSIESVVPLLTDRLKIMLLDTAEHSFRKQNTE